VGGFCVVCSRDAGASTPRREQQRRHGMSAANHSAPTGLPRGQASTPSIDRAQGPSLPGSQRTPRVTCKAGEDLCRTSLARREFSSRADGRAEQGPRRRMVAGGGAVGCGVVMEKWSRVAEDSSGLRIGGSCCLGSSKSAAILTRRWGPTDPLNRQRGVYPGAIPTSRGDAAWMPRPPPAAALAEHRQIQA